jgi:two-component system, OmpR family, sensor histidine kinase KdpD
VESDGRADNFLRMIQRARRGRLKIYLGYAAGVGKTYQMLLEGHRLRAEGIDVVVGLVETHGRVDTARLIEGLEVIPKVGQEYHGILVEEMDVDAVLVRKPEVVLVDELAHTNIPGSRNHKRYQDVQDILAAGIHVITTVNVQHLESLYDTVERGLGVSVRERLPDSVLAEAEEIINVDVSTGDLQQRLKEGKVYPEQRIRTALSNFFTSSNLEQLRELTLRELASQIDFRRREVINEDAQTVPDQVMVCLSSQGPNSEMLLRYASRLAGRLNRNWYAVYVQTAKEGSTVIDVATQRLISNTLTMAKQLGGTVFTYKGEDVVDTILRFAREYRVGHIVVGAPTGRSFWKRLRYGRSLVHRLIEKAKRVTVVMIDTTSQPVLRTPVEIVGESTPVVHGTSLLQESSETKTVPVERTSAAADESRMARVLPIGHLMTKNVLFWEEPVTKDEVIRALVHVACKEVPGCDEVSALRAVNARESEGSTFLNEGLAIPHARLKGIHVPGVALGITRRGIVGEDAGVPTGYVFLSITPDEKPETQIEILSVIAHAFQDRSFIQMLDRAMTTEDVRDAIAYWTEVSRRVEMSRRSGKSTGNMEREPISPT